MGQQRSWNMFMSIRNGTLKDISLEVGRVTFFDGDWPLLAGEGRPRDFCRQVLNDT